jgi:outer membrane protein
MKHLVKFFVITLLFFQFTNVFAQENIMYIDMKFILNSSSAGKNAQKALEKIHSTSLEKFKKTEESLKDEETLLLSKKKLIKKEDYEKLAKDLRKKVMTYQADRRLKNEEITKKRSSARAQLLEAINPILAEYTSSNNISIILDKQNIVIGKTELDITNIILQKLNKKLPKISLQ